MVKKHYKLKKVKISEKEKGIAFKLFLSIIYLIVISILIICAYMLYEEKKQVYNWSDVKSSNQYSYMNISRMSEKFAYDSKTGKSYHFVIETEKTGVWHTYLIAISDKDYDKYKNVIDYTYERVDKADSVKVYGYPVLIDNNLKELAIKNIKKFLPVENEIEITDSNFENYLTNSYLDTTIPKKDNFDYILFFIMLILVIVIVLFFITIFHKDNKDKDKVEDEIDDNNHLNTDSVDELEII